MMFGRKLVGRAAGPVMRAAAKRAVNRIPRSAQTIRVHYWGRLGNQLFQYSFGRILALNLGWNLSADPIEGFERATPLRTRRVFPTLKRQVLSGQSVDLAAVVADTSRRWISLEGFFQRYQYYRPYADEIRNDWLSASRLFELETHSITIHVRSGDIWTPEPHPDYVGLPFSYYQQIIDARAYRRVYVVTDDTNDPMVQKLHREFDATVRSGSVLDDFNFLMSSANLVLAVSTFSWWAAWLSAAAEIHYPVAGHFDPRVVQDVDLVVEDDPRYLLHHPHAIHPWRGTAANRAQMLES